MVLVKPIAQRELHPHFEGHRLSKPQSEGPQSLREGKVNKMVQNGRKKRERSQWTKRIQYVGQFAQIQN